MELETCEGYLDYDGSLNLKAVDDGSIDAKEYVTGVLQGNKGVKELEKIFMGITIFLINVESC